MLRFASLSFVSFWFHGFSLADRIRNVRVTKKAGELSIYFDEEEIGEGASEKGVWTEKSMKFQEAKDCAGVFVILVGNRCEKRQEDV